MSPDGSSWAHRGRRVCLAGLGALGVGLAVRPDLTAALFWWGLIPALPAVFLIHPGLWRNVCPLATLSMGPPGERRRLGAATTASPWSGAAGVVPLLLLVAWRGTGLDTDPAGTGALLAGVLGVAVVTGRRSERRSGFCNRLCPLLPVERLYGQRPWIEVGDSRCDSCTLCTPRGCVDLSPPAAAAQLLGPRRSRIDWLLTPFGAFAAAFPGFVWAWFGAVPPEGGVAALGAALTLGLVASWCVVATVVYWTGLSWRRALPTLAALAAGIYYGFAAPRAVAAFGGGGPPAHALQVAAVGFVALWWLRAVRMPGPRRAPPV